MTKTMLYCIAVQRIESGYRAYLTDDDTTFADGATEFDALRALIGLIEAEAYYGGGKQ